MFRKKKSGKIKFRVFWIDWGFYYMGIISKTLFFSSIVGNQGGKKGHQFLGFCRGFFFLFKGQKL